MAPRTKRIRGAQLTLAAALIAIAGAGLKGRLRRYEVAEASMAPTLQPGDYLVAVRSGELRRGDIVVYPDPAQPGRELIKRVVGVGGETVTITGGQVAIGGAVLAEPWADGPTRPDGKLVVPEDAAFTLGDNRRLSAGDSRATGPVPLNGMWRVVWRYWPPGSLGRPER